MKLYEAPGLSAPLSNAPLLLVTVWTTLSLFVQVTFVPTFTVVWLGLNAKFCIAMRTALEGAGEGAGDGADCTV